jgi:tRNA pseudouridine13 synthase
METIAIPEALPRERLLSTEGRPEGILKERPEDFLVEELPLYEPCGEGEHLYLGIQKRHMPHGELLRLLTRHFGVPESAVGAAGMKDRIAITRQTVSVHLPGRAAEGPVGEIDLGTDRATVLWTAWHRNKLRRGHLAGNRFVIRIRRVDPLAAPRIWRGLQRLEREGCPNYFGPQRFGYRGNTHRLGALVLREDWGGVLSELLGAGGSAFPEHQREGRIAFDEGRLDEAESAWGRNDHAERIALRKFARNGNARRAVLSTGDHTRSFWVSAAQSAIFNHLLDDRLRAGSLGTLEPGDVAFLHDREAAFLVGDEDPAELAARVEAREISPAGPLWGRKLLETRSNSRRDESRSSRWGPSAVSTVPLERRTRCRHRRARTLRASGLRSTQGRVRDRRHAGTDRRAARRTTPGGGGRSRAGLTGRTVGLSDKVRHSQTRSDKVRQSRTGLTQPDSSDGSGRSAISWGRSVRSTGTSRIRCGMRIGGLTCSRSGYLSRVAAR